MIDREDTKEIVDGVFELIYNLKSKERVFNKLLDFRGEIRSQIKHDSKPPIHGDESYQEYVYRRIWECFEGVDE